MISAIRLSIFNTHFPTPFLPFIAKTNPNNGNMNIEIITVLPNEPKEIPFIMKANNIIYIPKQIVERTVYFFNFISPNFEIAYKQFIKLSCFVSSIDKRAAYATKNDLQVTRSNVEYKTYDLLAFISPYTL